MLVKFKDDTVVDPRGSELFSWWITIPVQKIISSYFFYGMSLTWIFRFSASGEMVPLNETELYTEDRIGLKALDMVCIWQSTLFFITKSLFLVLPAYIQKIRTVKKTPSNNGLLKKLHTRPASCTCSRFLETIFNSPKTRLIWSSAHIWTTRDPTMTMKKQIDMSHLLLLGKFEYGGGPIFKVVLEC